MVAKGIELRPDLIASAVAADPNTDKSTLDEIAEKAMERAGSSTGAMLGTALHSFVQRLDRGEPAASLGAPAPLDRDLATYLATLRDHGLRTSSEWTERVVVCPELGIAGRLDRLVGQRPGMTHAAPLAVLDLKTGKDLSYAWLEIAIQLAIYARAPLACNPTTGAYEPMPADIDRDRALVLHLPVGKGAGQVYGVDIAKGWAAAQLAMAVRAARTEAKSLAWLVQPTPTQLALHSVSRAGSQQELAELWERLHPRGLWTEEVHVAAQLRMQEITPSPIGVLTS